MANLRKLQHLVKNKQKPQNKQKSLVRCITIANTQEPSGVTWQPLESSPVFGSSEQHCHLQLLKGGEADRLSGSPAGS